MTADSTAVETGRTEIRVKGKTVSVPSVEIDGRAVIASGKRVKLATLQDEELLEGELVANPESFVRQLKQSGLGADILTFAQKLPDATPKHPYYFEWDNLAVIPITTFSDWWDNHVEASVRRAVRKATKEGVVVKHVPFDDEFVKGIVNINNETPIRQGKPFWHFEKSFEAVRLENSTYAERNLFLGAYYRHELIGYIRLTCVDNCAHVIQILSMTKHFDKRPGNALISKAVEICEQMRLSHLVYCNYVYNDPKSSLTEFKRRNGFQKVLVPRYYVPLTLWGKVALGLRLHHGIVAWIPKPLLPRLLKARNWWYTRKSGSETV